MFARLKFSKKRNSRRNSGERGAGLQRAGFRRQTVGHTASNQIILKKPNTMRKTLFNLGSSSGRKKNLPAPMVPPQQIIEQQQKERESSRRLLAIKENKDNKLLAFKTSSTEEYNRIFEKLLDRDATKLVIKIGDYLTDIVGTHEMEKAAEFSKETLKFQGNSVPKIQLSFYICRIVELINDEADEACSNLDSVAIKQLLMSLIYLKRIIKKHEDFKLTYLNVHRMILSCFILAAKILDDESPTNLTFSYIGGLELGEINKLEGNFVAAIDFELHITRKQLQRQYKRYAEGYKMKELM